MDYDYIKDLSQVPIYITHRELPKWLFDWTIEPLVALYFAVNNLDYNLGKVWIFNPWKYNEIIIKDYQKPQINDIKIFVRAVLAYGANRIVWL